MSGHVLEIGDAEFADKVLKATTPVVVDFWAPWCGPCKSIAPVLEEIATELGSLVAIYKVNVDENPKSPSQYSVRAIPNLIIFIYRVIIEGCASGATISVAKGRDSHLTCIDYLILDVVGFHAVSGVAQKQRRLVVACSVVRLLFLHVPVQTLRSRTPLFRYMREEGAHLKEKYMRLVHAAPYQCFSTRGIKHHATLIY